ncbi:uncharacterized protein GJ701_005682 isoform 1-T3 [Geothlypis trichas]
MAPRRGRGRDPSSSSSSSRPARPPMPLAATTPGPAACHSARAPRHLTRPAPPPGQRSGALLRKRLRTHREGRGAVLRVRCPALRPPQRSGRCGGAAAGRGPRGAAAEAGRARRLRPPSCARGAALARQGRPAGSAGCARPRGAPRPPLPAVGSVWDRERLTAWPGPSGFQELADRALPFPGEQKQL